MSYKILSLHSIFWLFFLLLLSLNYNVVLAEQNLEICYNYGCYKKQKIIISNDDLNNIKNNIFVDKNNITNAEIERENIIKAVAFLYKIAGNQTPIFRDIAGNYNDPAHGKMDCIDHSNNTLKFLQLLQQNQLLKFHKIGQIETHYFLHLIPSHYAVSIKEINSENIYIIDSWYANIFQNELPKIFDINSWKNGDINLNVY